MICKDCHGYKISAAAPGSCQQLSDEAFDVPQFVVAAMTSFLYHSIPSAVGIYLVFLK